MFSVFYCNPKGKIFILLGFVSNDLKWTQHSYVSKGTCQSSLAYVILISLHVYQTCQIKSDIELTAKQSTGFRTSKHRPVYSRLKVSYSRSLLVNSVLKIYI